MQALFGHYRNGGITPSGTNRRRSFNNVFYAVNPSADPVYDAIAFVPSPSFPAETHGNSYFRLGNTTQKAFRYLAYPCATGTCPGGYFSNLAELRGSSLFQASKAQYAPGYGAGSIDTDPQFARMGADGSRVRPTTCACCRPARPATTAWPPRGAASPRHTGATGR